MKFYELCIVGSDYDSDLQLLFESKRLGYTGACIKYSPNNLPEKSYFKDLEEEVGIKVIPRIELKPENFPDLRKKVNKYRDKYKDYLISIHGGTIKVNRAACENLRVDILSHPYRGRRDPGMDHIHARAASRNNVAIELSLRDLIMSWSNVRAKLMQHFRDIIKLHRKFKFPLIVSSEAKSPYDLRKPKDIMSILECCFDLSKEEIINIVLKTPIDIIKFNEERPKMVVLGVKVL
ncbi:Ribonuclease P [Methanothermus fervidus DSM 2088]|uniref:Ribonuclease P protein component 3 n=1 Tax=Methanothermus fervidus (strain ATCC 43054 / DSM 2088 / JCM 10308 / V24 S) TaxID=523846 RepID=E3GZ86_METFV|nr:RNase P subunit p30 family protein [Methanothermus fervidus]ADP77618.1 Ribonuclease P [Methanothermus fervidus DSM 2088]